MSFAVSQLEYYILSLFLSHEPRRVVIARRLHFNSCHSPRSSRCIISPVGVHLLRTRQHARQWAAKRRDGAGGSEDKFFFSIISWCSLTSLIKVMHLQVNTRATSMHLARRRRVKHNRTSLTQNLTQTFVCLKTRHNYSTIRQIDRRSREAASAELASSIAKEHDGSNGVMIRSIGFNASRSAFTSWLESAYGHVIECVWLENKKSGQRTSFGGRRPFSGKAICRFADPRSVAKLLAACPMAWGGRQLAITIATPSPEASAHRRARGAAPGGAGAAWPCRALWLAETRGGQRWMRGQVGAVRDQSAVELRVGEAACSRPGERRADFVPQHTFCGLPIVVQLNPVERCAETRCKAALSGCGRPTGCPLAGRTLVIDVLEPPHSAESPPSMDRLLAGLCAMLAPAAESRHLRLVVALRGLRCAMHCGSATGGGGMVLTVFLRHPPYLLRPEPGRSPLDDDDDRWDRIPEGAAAGRAVLPAGLFGAASALQLCFAQPPDGLLSMLVRQRALKSVHPSGSAVPLCAPNWTRCSAKTPTPPRKRLAKSHSEITIF